MTRVFRQTVLTMISAAALAGCAGNWNFDEVSALKADQTFRDTLKSDYLALSRSEYDEGDYDDSSFFLDRARRAIDGEDLSPQTPPERELPPGTAPGLEAAYKSLTSVLTDKALARAPERLAHAISQYECWLQEQEEGFQADHIAACREGHETALSGVREMLARKQQLFVVLPDSDGEIGGIEIDDGTKKVLLDRPNAALRTGVFPTSEFEMGQDKVAGIFKAALESQPHPPRVFVLYFEKGKSDLTPESEPDLRAVYEDIARRQWAEVAVVGHTDRKGRDKYNDRLSEERADMVLTYLLGKGLNPSMFETGGMGERDPVVETADGVDEPRNRRVVVVIR